VGAVLAGGAAAEVLQSGDHGSTFGGNPLAAAGGLVVLETVDNPAFLAEIARKGEKFRSLIAAWRHPRVLGIRGRGLMIGVDIDGSAEAVLGRALEAGLLLLSAGEKTLRVLPPYIVEDAEIDEGLEILRGLL
jgi:acetylornithine/N-succinyldiaminopimelate aminotransferase